MAKTTKTLLDNELTCLWKLLREQEKLFTHYKGSSGQMKKKLRFNYKAAENKFDKLLRQKKRKYNRDQILAFDELSDNNPKAFWDKLKNLGPKQRKQIPLRVKINVTYDSDLNTIKNRWKADYESLYNSQIDENCDFYRNCINIVNEYDRNTNQSGDVEHEYINADITFEEVESVIKSVKANKSPGLDSIPNECLKQKDIILILWKLISLCFKYSLIPSIWLKAIISPIPKSSLKDPYVPLNYRGISLLSNVYKIYSSIINKRIMKYCDFNSVLVDEQNGFRRDRSCNDHIFCLSSVIQNRLSEKKSTFCAFVDMEKAFDKIDRNLIFYSLLNYNIKGKIYKAIKSLYSETWSCIRISNFIYTDFF